MKFFIHMIIAALLLLIPATASEAFQNEPNGFRDLYWGESLQEVQQTRAVKYFEYHQKNDSVFYIVYLHNGEEKTVSGIPLLSGENPAFLAGFWNNQLWSIDLLFPASNLYEAQKIYRDLKVSMVVNFGQSSHCHESEYHNEWIGNNTYITSYILSTGVVINLTSIKILNNIAEVQSAKGW